MPLLPVPLQPQPPQSLTIRLREILTQHWLGRLFVAVLVVRILLLPFGLIGIENALLELLRKVANLLLIGIGLYGGLRLWMIVQRRLLWRVRRRLILSYVLMGLVPVLLVGLFFVFAGWLFLMNVGSYLVVRSLDARVMDADDLAQSVATEIADDPDLDPADVLARHVAVARGRYPDVSMTVARLGTGQSFRAGVWEHAPPPPAVPPHVVESGRYIDKLPISNPNLPDEPLQLVARSAACAPRDSPTFCAIVDVPMGEGAVEQLHRELGIRLEELDEQPPERSSLARDAAGRIPWSTHFSYRDWATGKSLPLEVSFRARPLEIYERMAAARWVGSQWTFGQLLFLLLLVVAGMFLVIYAVAFIMGFSLARSITGAIHQLFTATERIRENDFTHRIEVRTRDQLGELAVSFNAMTSSIQHLLQEQAEKQRLQEELRIARDIQASLLPRGPLRLPGVTMAALCVPAREVGGDYYDFFLLAEDRVGLLVADVSGKGTSAALYMAELKGLVLSLSKVYPSPKQLLIEVNRVLSESLDSRSFITMTYAIMDLSQRTLTYARAGHTPLIHLLATEPCARILTPNGLVLGLRLEGIAAKFEQLLEEVVVPLAPGDLCVLFTDGITEAMNVGADLFGEGRLCQHLEQQRHLPLEELREHIHREVNTWVGEADQHDDMTMILLKVG